MPQLKKGTKVPTPKEDAKIAAGIAADPDTYELSDEEFLQLRPLGRPRLDNPKVSISMRLDADVLAALRATGPGWQTRVNELLRSAMQAVTKPTRPPR